MPGGDAAAQIEPFSVGYAAMFGSGVYRLGDGTQARVLRVPFFKTLRAPSLEPRRMGVRLLLPVTAGVQQLDPDDLPPGRVDDRVEQVSFLPGVELELPRTERWTLRARGQLGWGSELEGAEDSVRLFAASVRSRFIWPNAPARPALINGLMYGAIDPKLSERRTLVRLTNAVEFDVRIPRWQFRDETMHLFPHLLGDWYYTPADALSYGKTNFEHVATEWQIGLAAGRETGFELWRFEIDRIGVAYRFSDHSAGIKVFVGSVF